MNRPYGGTLVDLLVRDAPERAEWQARAARAPRIILSPRSLCDLELLATGALSPLTTFVGEADYRRVLAEMRLADGRLYPIPVTLPLPDDVPARRGDVVALHGRRGEALAVLTIEDAFEWDRRNEALRVCGTTDDRHPLVAEMASWPRRYVTGALKVLRLPCREGFPELRRTPAQVRTALAQLGAERVVAFQTRNPMHRVHEELTKRAAREIDAVLLIHPAVGQTRPGDVNAQTRILCYRELVARYYDPSRTLLSLLPIAMRMAGPREALWHALIRRNYGATHMIVGRDHAGPGRDSNGRPFYEPHQSRELVRCHEHETGVSAVTFEELVYLPEDDRYVERSRANGRSFVTISGTQVREQYLKTGQALPSWFTRPEVAAILARQSGRGAGTGAHNPAPASAEGPAGRQAGSHRSLAAATPAVLRRPLKRVLRTVGIVTSRLRPLPDFLIIGTHRGGTTSLYRYLEQHPSMAGTFPRSQQIKGVRYFDEHYVKGSGWYRSHFPTEGYRERLRSRLGSRVLTGEASPYYLFHPAAAERAWRLVPHARLIVLLREPVERAYSQWALGRRLGRETLPTFEDALAAEPERLAGEADRILDDPRYYSVAHEHFSYVSQGVYVDALRKWLAYFPRDQVLVESTEHLLEAPQCAYDAVLRFLGLPPFQLLDARRWNTSTSESRIRPETREALAGRLAPHNRALEDFLGIEFGWGTATAA